MNMTYEDRKNKGSIDNKILTDKPVFSFNYAWFLVTDTTAQFVESHDEGVYNKDMTDEQKAEVISFYESWEAPIVEVYVPTLEESKLQLKMNLKQKRQEDINAPVNGVEVGSLENRENLQGAIAYFPILSQGSTFIKWTMEDDTESELTLVQLQGILDTYVLRKGQIFALYQVAKNAIEACVTIKELEAL